MSPVSSRLGSIVVVSPVIGGVFVGVVVLVGVVVDDEEDVGPIGLAGLGFEGTGG